MPTKAQVGIIEDDLSWRATYADAIANMGTSDGRDMRVVTMPATKEEMQVVLSQILDGSLKVDVLLLDGNLWGDSLGGAKIRNLISEKRPEVVIISVSSSISEWASLQVSKDEFTDEKLINQIAES